METVFLSANTNKDHPNQPLPNFANKTAEKKMNAWSVLVVALVQVFNCFHPDGSHVVQDHPRHQTKHEHQASHQTRCLGGIREEQTQGEVFEACWLR